MVMILEVCARKIMASFVMVIVNFFSNVYSGSLMWDLLFNISSASELQPDSSGGEGVDSIALGKLIEVMDVRSLQFFFLTAWNNMVLVFNAFQVISEESKSSNLIVLLKDVEKFFTECRESHALLRSELPPGVLIIGSHIHADNHKDQVHLCTY